MEKTKKVVTRFAPSPTGLLHLGAYRTAIFAYLYARKNGGEFVLRIEDTDKERNKKEYEENIIESLKWLNLPYDIFYRQSEKLDRHTYYLKKMIDDGHAYISSEVAKDGSGVMKELVRFKNPNIDVTFHDEVKGDVTMNTTDLGDFVIAKNINEPLFHLAVVVDDFESGVTHVIRGEDHTSNTPRQILIQRAIGAPTPIYAHLPLVLGTDKLKLSKRRGALPVTEYRDRGYLPDAILNGVAFIGWNPGGEKEIYTHDELIQAFSLDNVQKSPAVFNEEKLKWFNKEHLKNIPQEEKVENILERLQKNKEVSFNEEIAKKIVYLILERISYYGEVDRMVEDGEVSYFFQKPETYKMESLIWKNSSKEKTLEYLSHIKDIFSDIKEDNFTKENIKEMLWGYAEEKGRGDVLWPLRYALSGREKSPDPFVLVEVFGKDESISRIEFAINLLQK
jgi:glutamyl-tRNA synthetase